MQDSLTPEIMQKIEANRLAALERKRLREEYEKDILRPEEERAIKTHLKALNRPFNAINLVDEFGSRFKKNNVIKALKKLEESKEITVKTIKKTKIYLADQNQFQIPSLEELLKLDEGIKSSESLLKTLREELSVISVDNDELERGPTDIELQIELERLEESVTDLVSRVLRETFGITTTLAPLPVLEKQHKIALAASKKRKNICLKLVETLSQEDHGRFTKRQLLEDLGIIE